jgi:transcription initiation factor TFIIH subunit 1
MFLASIFILPFFSPDGKAKIQLQIVLHDGNSTTFHFVNPTGEGSLLKDLM